MGKPYDTILVPGGGLTKECQLPERTKRRLDKAIEIQTTEHIIALSAGTVHKPPILDRDGYPLFECSVATEYLVEKGIDYQKILREQASYDTIGNAYFTRVIHTDPRQWRKLLVITSEFHIEGTQGVFSWVFSLDSPRPAYKLTAFGGTFLATNTYEHENRTENPCVGVFSSRVSISLFHCAQLAIDKFFALRITLIGSLLKAVSKASLCPSP